MSSFANRILDWLWPNRAEASGLTCRGAAHVIARRFVAVLGVQEGYHAALAERHIATVVNALRATGHPVTKHNVVWYTVPRRLEWLTAELPEESDQRGLADYLHDLGVDDIRLIAHLQVELAASLDVASASWPDDRRDTCGEAACDLAVGVLSEVCFLAVWVATVVVWAAMFWIAFNDLGIAALVEHSALSLKQSFGLGLLVTCLINSLNGRTDALAKRTVNRFVSQL